MLKREVLYTGSYRASDCDREWRIVMVDKRIVVESEDRRDAMDKVVIRALHE
jgi:hypothetical protein